MTHEELTATATGRRRDRPSGKSRITVRLDEWLFKDLKRLALRGRRSLSQQCEMILHRYTEEKLYRAHAASRRTNLKGYPQPLHHGSRMAPPK